MVLNKLFVLGILIILFINLSFAYSSTVTINPSSTIGTIRGDFYGVNSKMQPSWGDGIKSYGNSTRVYGVTNATFYQEKLNQSNIKILRTPMFLADTATASGGFVSTGYSNFSAKKEMVKWAYENGYKVILIADNTPTWLDGENFTWCSAVYYYTCAPNDTQRWANMVLDYITNVTASGLYNSTVMLEVWNEPDLRGSFLYNLTETTGNATIRSIEYNKIYNATYTTVKAKYPNMPIGGFGGGYLTLTTAYPLFENFLSNFSDRMDFFSYHNYRDDTETDWTYSLTNHYDRIYSNFTKYNVVNKTVYLDEFGVYNSTIQNTSAYEALFKSLLAETYVATLNYNPASISLEYYKLYGDANYSTGNSSEYPYRHEMLTEPVLDNKIYVPYNITKLFSSYHKAGNTILNTNSSRNDLKIVASKDTTRTYITLTNTNSTGVNVTLNIGETGKYLTDVETGEAFNGTMGIFVLNNLGGYAVKTYYTSNRYTGLLGTECDDTTNAFFKIILDLSAIAVVVFVIVYAFKDGIDDIDLGKMLILGVAIIVAIALFQASADNLALGSCG